MELDPPETKPESQPAPPGESAGQPGFAFSLAELMLASLAAGMGMALAGFSGPIVFFVFAVSVVVLLCLVVRHLTNSVPEKRWSIPAAASVVLAMGLGLGMLTLLPVIEFVPMLAGLITLAAVAPVVAFLLGFKRGLCTVVIAGALLGGPFGMGYYRGVLEAELESATDSRTLYVDSDCSVSDVDRDPVSGLPLEELRSQYWLAQRARLAGHNWRIRTTLDGGRMVTRFPWGGLVLVGLLLTVQFGVLRWARRALASPARDGVEGEGTTEARTHGEGHGTEGGAMSEGRRQ